MRKYTTKRLRRKWVSNELQRLIAKEILIPSLLVDAAEELAGPELQQPEPGVVIEQREGYIYLIKAEGAFYKIGKSADAKGRLKDLQTASPYKLHLVKCIQTFNTLALEKAFHARFKARHVRGEWFDLTVEDVGWFLRLPDEI